MALYRRLLSYLRPHWWRMAGTIASSVIAAGLSAFSLTLLIPFLNAIFGKQQFIPPGGKLAALQTWLLGAFLDPAHPLPSLEAMMAVIVNSAVHME